MGNNQDEAGTLRGAVDYKVLFVGACTLLLVLGGGLVGLYSRTSDNRFLELKHAIDGDIGELRRINETQWSRLNTIHDALIGSAARIDHLRESTNDQETRIRELERELKRRR